MAERTAPHIPNLLSLRGNRGGRGRGRGGRFDPSEVSHQNKDAIVQQTDQDASISRMSAVDLGYLEDPFAEYFVTKNSPRRYPIINRGTYMRTQAIDILVKRFVDCEPGRRKQVVSLGAGSDTRFFRLAATRQNLDVVYHELDFAANTKGKIEVVKRTPGLLKIVHDQLKEHDGEEVQISADGSELLSKSYNIHALDLRTLASSEGPLRLKNLSRTLPTLLISECCLTYLPPTSADAVLSKFTGELLDPGTPCGIIIYEPIRPFDAFGQVMISNLAQRGIILQTLQKYSSLAAQKQRMRDTGFTDGQEAADVDFLFNRWVDEGEKERVGKCEMLDELEEWVLLAQHYCVAWGWRGGSGEESLLFNAMWKELPCQPE